MTMMLNAKPIAKAMKGNPLDCWSCEVFCILLSVDEVGAAVEVVGV